MRDVADVAGGQGLLARILAKRYNYRVEVIDPRGHTLRGVAGRAQPFTPDMAGRFDLIVGLHPDEALPAVVAAAALRPALIVPCCNFWSPRPLGSAALLDALQDHFRGAGNPCRRVTLAFSGPKNIALCVDPPPQRPLPAMAGPDPRGAAHRPGGEQEAAAVGRSPCGG